MNERITALEVHYADMKDDLQEIRHAVCGNGKTGLKTRVDRLEQRRFLVDWALKIILGAAFGFILAELFT